MTTNSASNGRGIWDWAIVRGVSLLAFLSFSAVLFFGGFNEPSLRQLIRLSAQFSVTLFAMAFIATALHQSVKKSFSWWWFMNRRYFGISFAILHLIHLLFLIVLQAAFHPVFEQADMSSLFGGGMAYVFVVLMLLTSFKPFSNFLSRTQWKNLHTLGGYWIWGIFMISYSGRIVEGEINYLLPWSILFVVIGFRIWWWMKKRKT